VYQTYLTVKSSLCFYVCSFESQIKLLC